VDENKGAPHWSIVGQTRGNSTHQKIQQGDQTCQWATMQQYWALTNSSYPDKQDGIRRRTGTKGDRAHGRLDINNRRGKRKKKSGQIRHVKKSTLHIQDHTEFKEKRSENSTTSRLGGPITKNPKQHPEMISDRPEKQTGNASSRGEIWPPQCSANSSRRQKINPTSGSTAQ